MEQKVQPAADIHEERNYGIDLLRLVSMFLVVLLHTFNVVVVTW